jgi:GTP cyclohydrolase FolE2
MNAPERLPLPDMQSMPDHRALAIDRVGIRGLRHPVRVACGGEALATVATLEMSVALPPEVKGTHMSRFLEVLQAHTTPLATGSLAGLLRTMLERLDARAGSLSIRFPYFVTKRAPVSGVESLMDYDVCLRADGTAEAPGLGLEVQVPVTSLCPCSKEISEYGAHNQRSVITIDARLAGPLDPEDLIAMAERAASCELYGLLKRPDEKYVTERAYDNPKFVEDLVRDVAMQLDRDPRILAYRVASENFESIHNHSAYAVIERDKSAG